LSDKQEVESSTLSSPTKDNDMNEQRVIITILFETGYNLPELKEDDPFSIIEVAEMLGAEINAFDWKETEEGAEWEEKMNKKRFEVRTIDDGSDTYTALAIPQSKLELIELAAKYLGTELLYTNWESDEI
jgi:hypothetical protein